MKQKSIKVCITWEHGDADFETKTEPSFNTEDEAREFLNFIFDFRKFVRGQGWEKLGHFSDDYHTSVPEWRAKIVKSHGSKFEDLIEEDKSGMGGGGYSAHIEHIFVKIGNTKHYIVWTKGFRPVVLPKIGDVLNLTTGSISGLGPKIFGGTHKKYVHYEDFKDLGEPKGDGTEERQYPKIKGKVIDCKLEFYKDSNYDHDFSNFHYILLIENERGIFTTAMHGYDADYEKKFGRSMYDGIKVFEV